MKRLALFLLASSAIACDEKPTGVGAYAQKLYVVAGKTPVSVTIDGQQRQVEPGRVEEIGVSVGKHRFSARTLSAGTFTQELDVRELEELVVPVAAPQCFVTIDAKKQKILRRQKRAEPMRRARLPIVVAADDARRNGTYITQSPCELPEMPEGDLYTTLARGVAWEDLIIPGTGTTAKAVVPGEGSNETELPPTAEEEGANAARRPLIDAYLKQIDQVVGINHAGRTEGRSPTAIWVKDGRVAIVNLASDMIAPPQGKPGAARAKKIGAAVKAVLAKKPSTAPGEVLSLENLELYAVDKETIDTYQKMYQGIVRETFPVARREGSDAVIFLYRVGPGLWVTQSMKQALAGASVDLATQVAEMDRNESAAVAQCVSQIAAVKAGSCATTKTEAEAGARLHRLITAPPVTPLYVQLLVDSKAGTNDLRLFEASPGKLPREQTTIGFNLKVAVTGLTAE
ncbi:MAG: hypothetical protein KIT84_06210 [Labilithrix sp.]|nr:hypothetical protein [Labilithrix sp.]MCW5810585.1 hypothetical protein [Labilithrix sp.]